MLQISVAQQQALTRPLTSLTQQRREVLPHPEALETLARPHHPHQLMLIPGAENRSNFSEIIPLSKSCKETLGPPLDDQDPYDQLARAGP